jgi:lipoprotein-releasing system ATP-binding protein
MSSKMADQVNDNKTSATGQGGNRDQAIDSQRIVQCVGVSKHFQAGPERIEVLNDIHFNLSVGDWVSVVGTSGSGKSTLLNILGTLDKSSSGQVLLRGKDVACLRGSALNAIRNKHLGFVYQFHHLLPEFTAIDNVAMPLMIQGQLKTQAHKAAETWLEAVGLGARAKHKPGELSGGERQRAAIARALVNQPDLVLMDEPTGNLDGQTAKSIQQLIQSLNEQSKTAFLVVTHDLNFASQAHRVLELQNGQLVNADD